MCVCVCVSNERKVCKEQAVNDKLINKYNIKRKINLPFSFSVTPQVSAASSAFSAFLENLVQHLRVCDAYYPAHTCEWLAILKSHATQLVL